MKEFKKRQLIHVGTLSNKVEIPVGFCIEKTKMFNHHCMYYCVVIFSKKEKKAVVMVSSMYHTISDGPESEAQGNCVLQ